MKWVFVLALFGLSLQAGAQAADPKKCETWGCYAKLEQIVVNQSGIYLGTTADETLADCTAEGKVYLTLQQNHPNFESIYAGLVAAQLADRAVVLRTVDKSKGCEVSYVEFRK